MALTQRKWFVPLCLMLILVLALVRINAQHNHYSRTPDEAVHLLTGIEWWQFGEYKAELLHPPLARIAAASLPYAFGFRLEQPITCPQNFAKHYQYIDEYHKQGEFKGYCFHSLDFMSFFSVDLEQLVWMMRLGMLPFFLLLALYTYRLAALLCNPIAGLFAAAFVTHMPVILTHASLATTDI